jgi:hypothetical protein
MFDTGYASFCDVSDTVHEFLWCLTHGTQVLVMFDTQYTSFCDIWLMVHKLQTCDFSVMWKLEIYNFSAGVLVWKLEIFCLRFYVFIGS